MAIPSRQIGWSTKSNLLWQISKQLETLTRVMYNRGTTTTTTTTSSPNDFLTTLSGDNLVTLSGDSIITL
jgi:hypothetical protein